MFNGTIFPFCILEPFLPTIQRELFKVEWSGGDGFVGLSARWGKCPCQCRCDVCSSLSCYMCQWHQNCSRSCCTNRRIRLRTILPWTATAFACRKTCVRNNTIRWPSMGDRLFEHRHNRLRVRRNIRPEAIGIGVGSSAHDDMPWRVHQCFRQPAQCMLSLCPSRSTETTVVLRTCLQSRSRHVACVAWRTGRRRSLC